MLSTNLLLRNTLSRYIDILPEKAPDRARQNETVEGRLHRMVAFASFERATSYGHEIGERFQPLDFRKHKTDFLQTACPFRFAALA